MPFWKKTLAKPEMVTCSTSPIPELLTPVPPGSPIPGTPLPDIGRSTPRENGAPSSPTPGTPTQNGTSTPTTPTPGRLSALPTTPRPMSAYADARTPTPNGKTPDVTTNGNSLTPIPPGNSSNPLSPLHPTTSTEDLHLLTVACGKTRTPTPSRRSQSVVSVLDLETLIQLSSERPNLKNNLVNDLELEHECPVCCSVLRYPLQFDMCEHHCCAACLKELFRFAWRCPIEQRRINEDKVSLDKAFQDEVEALAARCINIGCRWEGTIRELVDHMSVCRHRLITCPNGCGKIIEKRRMNKHRRNDCEKRNIPCEFCGEEVMKDDEMGHVAICPKFVVMCPNECKKAEICRENMQFHLEKECPNQEIPCPFVDAGCAFMGERRNLRKHFRDEPITHLGLACDYIIQHKHVLDTHTESLTDMDTKFMSVNKQLENLDKQLSSQLVWKIDGFAEKFQLAKLGKKPTIYSPTFVTSVHGYKMALSACLYGDGKARGKHVSLFTCICKGDYDALLQWPFRHRVTLTLLDQNPDVHSRRNILHTVKPNTSAENQPFLGRPVAERNASFGVQSFVEIDLLNSLDYVVDDTMFIRCTVDFSNILKL